MSEIELKFQVPAAVQAEVAHALARGRTTDQRLVAHYVDSSDHLLSRHHIALRLRHDGARWIQTLKAPGADMVARLEHEVDLGGGARTQPPQLDIARHEGTQAGAQLRAALGQRAKGGDALHLQFVVDVQRRMRVLRRPLGLVEIAFDQGTITAGNGRQRTVRELEFELKAGSALAMFQTALQWSQRHGLWLDLVSKSQRGHLLTQGGRSWPAVGARPVQTSARISGPELMRTAIAACLPQIVVNAGEIAAGSEDADHVHQLRVGIRRLRTVLRELGASAEGTDPAWEAPVVAVFRALGTRRDAESLAQTVEPELKAAGEPATTLPSTHNRTSLAHVVRDAAFQKTLLGLLAFAHIQPTAAAQQAAMPLVRRRLKKLHEAVVRDGERFASLSTEDQHRVRKRLKRLRYLAEITAGMFDRRAVARYLKHTRKAQDALGRHNDRATAIEAYRNAAGSQPTAWFAVGWLGAQQGQSAQASQTALQKIATAHRFWKR